MAIMLNPKDVITTPSIYDGDAMLIDAHPLGDSS